MKEVILRDDIVFVRNNMNYIPYGVLKHQLLRFTVFMRYGKIVWDDEGEKYKYRKLVYLSMGSRVLKIISEFIEELNKGVEATVNKS